MITPYYINSNAIPNTNSWNVENDIKSLQHYEVVSSKEKYSYIKSQEFYTPTEVKYFYKNDFIGIVPIKLDFLINSFRASESILELLDDWDENGSIKYEYETWKEAIKFLIDYSTTLLRDFNTLIDKPNIYNGPNGSIDILWENTSYTFLINIHKNCKDVSFYADDTINTQRIKGEFQLNNYKKNLIPFAIQF